jgi:hypothetical protein
VAGIEILDKAQELNNDSIVVPLRKVLTTLSQKQSDASCIWEASGQPPMVSSQDRQIFSDLYEVAMSQEPRNAYRLGLLALLSGKNPVQSSIESTVEDYLYKELWKAVHETKPLEELSELGNSIKRYGPGYFEDEDRFGWPYALPLLVTQEYRTALSYIADAGGPMGLLQATHLGIALHISGVALKDFAGAGVTAAAVDNILTTLLERYATYIRAEPSAGNVASLEYLVRIPQKARAMKEVRNMFVHDLVCPVHGIQILHVFFNVRLPCSLSKHAILQR